MTSLPTKIRRLMPNGRYGNPVTECQIEETEKQLGAKLPPSLRELYRSFNGLSENLGNASYLLPLAERSASLLGVTKLYWEEWPAYFPTLDLRPFVFFGCTGGDENWGIRVDEPHDLILYGRLMEDEYEAVAGGIYEAYAADLEEYKTAAEEE